MASVSAPGPVEVPPSRAVQEFAARHYLACGAQQFGMDEPALAKVLAQVAAQGGVCGDDAAEQAFLASLRLEELILARACACGNHRAWEIFLTRYRSTLYEAAYKIAPTESTAREVADSLYADLYGVGAKGEQHTSKLLYYLGRGSLQGWLRVVTAQEYIKGYRRYRRETSLDAAVEEGLQFAAPEPDRSASDPRVESAVTAELAALDSEERFLLAAYYLDHRTLAEIAKLRGVHESTVSRQLDRIAAAARKRIRKRLMRFGMSARQADEAMQETDVQDLRVAVRETLQQAGPNSAFSTEKGGREG